MALKRKRTKSGYVKIKRKVEPYKDKNGKTQLYKVFYGKTLQEAESKYEKYKARDEGRSPEFLGDLVDEFIANNFLQNPKYKPSTQQRYIDAYRKNLATQEIAAKSITSITYRDMQEAYMNMTCGSSSIGHCKKLMRLFFKFMVQQGVIERDPSEGVVVPKPQSKALPNEVVVFTKAERHQIKSYITSEDLDYYEQRRVDRLRFMLMLARYTGMRISEILALTYKDITEDKIIVNKQIINTPVFKNGKIVKHELSVETTKTQSSIRTLPNTKELYAEYLRHKQWHIEEMQKKGYETNQIFTTSTGKLYDKHSLRHTLDRIHMDAGVPTYGFHAYRRTFGTELAEKGVSIQVLASLMGHSDISVTAKYYINVASNQKADAMVLLE